MDIQNDILNKPIALSNLFWIIVVLILLAGNIFLAVKYFTIQEELKQAQIDLSAQRVQDKALNFTKLFISNVLKAEGEIDFETRLKLESAVRELGDEEILDKWKLFVNSQTEEYAQNSVKELLETLVNKIKLN